MPRAAQSCKAFGSATPVVWRILWFLQNTWEAINFESPGMENLWLGGLGLTLKSWDLGGNTAFLKHMATPKCMLSLGVFSAWRVLAVLSDKAAAWKHTSTVSAYSFNFLASRPTCCAKLWTICCFPNVTAGGRTRKAFDAQQQPCGMTCACPLFPTFGVGLLGFKLNCPGTLLFARSAPIEIPWSAQPQILPGVPNTRNPGVPIPGVPNPRDSLECPTPPSLECPTQRIPGVPNPRDPGALRWGCSK